MGCDGQRTKTTINRARPSTTKALKKAAVPQPPCGVESRREVCFHKCNGPPKTPSAAADSSRQSRNSRDSRHG